MNPELRERLARVLASALGDDFDAAFESKSEWIKERGGEPFRDVNMPHKGDYLEAVSALLTELEAARWCVVPEVPTEEMEDIGTDILYERGCNPVSDDAVAVFSAMLRASPKI